MPAKWTTQCSFFVAGLACWAFLPTAATPSHVNAKPLDEPEAAKYFNFPPHRKLQASVPLERVRDVSPEEFEERIRKGIPFIVEDAGIGNPFLNASCQSFHLRWPKARMRAEYTGGRKEKFISLGGSAWFQEDRPLRPKKGHMAAGRVKSVNGPYVWHVKDGGQEAPAAVRAEVQAAWQPPYFLRGKVNTREANESTEFWFSRQRGAVFAHADTYCIPAVSLQLTGRKEWRLMPAPPLNSAVGRYDSHDGEIYASGLWRPSYSATVEAGEAVVLFPNLFHETFVPEDGNPDCTVATTFQFQLPVPTQFLRAFLPTLATSHLYHEGHCRDLWHSYATLSPPGSVKPTINETLARSQAGARFAEVDEDCDGRLSLQEVYTFLAAPAQAWAKWFLTDDYFYDFKPTAKDKTAMSEELLQARARDSLAYCDLNNDKFVSLPEFEESWWQWSLVHHRVATQERLASRGATPKEILKAEQKYLRYGGGRARAHSEL